MKTDSLVLTKILDIRLVDGAGDVLTYNQMGMFRTMVDRFNFHTVGVSRNESESVEWARATLRQNAEAYGLPVGQLRFEVASAELLPGMTFQSLDGVFFETHYATYSVE